MTTPADRILGWWLEGRLAVFADGWKIHQPRRRGTEPEWLPLEVVDVEAARHIHDRTVGLDRDDEAKTRLARESAIRRLINAHRAEHGQLLREELDRRGLIPRPRRGRRPAA